MGHPSYRHGNGTKYAVSDEPTDWRGQSDPGHPDSAPITLRFRMRSAELYSVAFG